MGLSAKNLDMPRPINGYQNHDYTNFKEDGFQLIKNDPRILNGSNSFIEKLGKNG